MDAKKNARLEEFLKQRAAEFINRESSSQSLITVTRLELIDERRVAMIYISVLPTDASRVALSFIEHHLGELREYVKDHSELKSLPHFAVCLEPNSNFEA